MICEYCANDATHHDSVTDPENSRIGIVAYKTQYLCLVHAQERRRENTSRVQCLHLDIDQDGQCYTCGTDCRGIR